MKKRFAITKLQMPLQTARRYWFLKLGASLVLGCWSLVLLPCAFAQGSLTPPGSPGPIMKTLDQVKPGTPIPGGSSGFTISASGSYYLTGNLTIATGNAIQVNASSVNIDLNGFVITGPGKNAGSSEIGISGAAASNVNVRNGKILQFPNDGIQLSAVAVVEDVMVEACGRKGINVGEQSRVERCRVGATADIGINVADSSIVSSCIVIGATNYGIKAGFGCQILQSVSNYNNGPGIFASNSAIIRDCTASLNSSGGGIFAGVQSTLQNCAAYSNTGSFGIEANNGSTLINCTAAGNTTSYGIYAVEACTLNNCSAFYNTGTHGIFVDSYGTLTNCVARQNTVTYGIFVSRSTMQNCAAAGNIGPVPSSYGIYAAFSSVVINCSAYTNTNSVAATADSGVGIYASASTVKDCTAGVNKGDGIQVLNNCTITGNTSYLNGNSGDGAGIHATSITNRIEGNHVSNNDRGIDVDGSLNFIVKNTAGFNTINYEIAGANKVGVIVVALDSDPISGNSGGNGVGSTDPWANFTIL